MTAPRLLPAWPLLLGLVACPSTGEPGGSEDLAAISSRLDTAEQRLTAIETKLDALTTTLDQTVVSFEPLAAWASERKAASDERTERRTARSEGLGASLGRDPIEDEPPTVSSREIPGAAEAITCDQSDPVRTQCTIDRAFVDHVLANPALLAKQARIVPSQKDGVTQGYKLYGIRRDSLPKLLGMKNGDMLTSINGKTLDSMDKAMELYTELRTATRLEIELARKGSPMTIVIELK